MVSLEARDANLVCVHCLFTTYPNGKRKVFIVGWSPVGAKFINFVLTVLQTKLSSNCCRSIFVYVPILMFFILSVKSMNLSSLVCIDPLVVHYPILLLFQLGVFA